MAVSVHMVADTRAEVIKEIPEAVVTAVLVISILILKIFLALDLAEHQHRVCIRRHSPVTA